jgi:putative transposase
MDLYGFVIMPDHIHLIIKLQGAHTLPAFVRQFKTYIAHRLAKGPIWQRNYWSELIVHDRMLAQKLEYIHENPVRKGIVEHAEDYPWSSAKEYLVKDRFELIDSYCR